MNTVLGNATNDNARFTIFENDQVLTADQLNDLFNYLDVQTRLTRTRAIGVGIICGLELGITAQHQLVVSRGSALTTDGDLLHLDSDRFFDRYIIFEDQHAHYPFFKNDQTTLPLYELLAGDGNRNSISLADFEGSTNTRVKDYAGVLYLEEYLNDPDVCSGTHCDNKGIETVRQLKVILVHKDQLRILLQSVPSFNKNYFSLSDVVIRRPMVDKNVDKWDELQKAFSDVFTVKKDLQEAFTQALETCRPIVAEEFNGADPAADWNNLLEEQFKPANPLYAQYIVDYGRDLCCAYNELRDSLFENGAICCPDVHMFPKHVLLGLVQTASVQPPVTPVRANSEVRGSIDNSGGRVASGAERLNLARLSTNVHFNPGRPMRRYHPLHIDTTYRHQFWGSPLLLGNEEHTQKTRFLFRRIDAMIRNFKVPTAETFANGVQNIRITPSHFEDKPLGDRSIPFYYHYNPDYPIHLYWNYQANIRQKENQIYAYHAPDYSEHPAAVAPLLHNWLPFDFFRIEGHIGFPYQQVEKALHNIIQSHNLPINLVILQVEKNRQTIRPLPWFFPHLQVYENSIRNSLFDHMNQVELYHTNLRDQIKDQPQNVNTNVKLSIDNFSNARNKVFASKPLSDPEFNPTGFKQDVDNAIKAATDVKVQTRDFSFSHAAAPHDFVINTGIFHKIDLYTNLLQQLTDQKKDELMLGNFLQNNPGLEHCAGVLRGGTFVLVYTSSDNRVVADFMLPYASIDKDITTKPPVVQPLPVPNKPKLELSKVFEKIPSYKWFVEEKLRPLDIKFAAFDEKLKPFDDKLAFYDKVITDRMKIIDDKINIFDKSFSDKLNGFNDVFGEKLNGFDKAINDKTKGLDEKIKGVDRLFDEQKNGLDKTIDQKINQYDAALKDKLLFSRTDFGAQNPVKNNNTVGDRDLSREVDALKAKQKEVDTLPAGTPARTQKEQELLALADSLSNVLNQAAAGATDKTSATNAKAILFDLQETTAPLKNNQAHINTVNNIATRVGAINKTLNTRFNR